MSTIRKMLAGIAVAFAISSPALADGSWSSSATEPAIYQTNFWNGPKTITSLVSSSSAVITKISFAWGYSYRAHPLNPSYTISGAACWNKIDTICSIGTGAVTGGAKNNTSDLAGYAANKDFSIYTNAVSSTTKAFPSAGRPLASRTFALTVNYTE